MPVDPWGKPYIYRFPSQHGLDFDLCSAGADRDENTEDDICNWCNTAEKVKVRKFVLFPY